MRRKAMQQYFGVKKWRLLRKKPPRTGRDLARRRQAGVNLTVPWAATASETRKNIGGSREMS